MTGPAMYDPIEEALKILGRVGPHALPASRSLAIAPKDAPPRGHMLPTVSVESPPTLRAHALPAMRSVAPPPPVDAPSQFEMADPSGAAAAMPVAETPSNALPGQQGAISAMFQGLLATHPLNPQNGPQGGLLAQQGAPPPMSDAGPDALPQPAAAHLSAPNAAPLPPMPQKTSMVDRIQNRIQGLLGGDESKPYAGLLSGEQMKEGKVSPLWWLLGPAGKVVGSKLAQDRLDKTMQLKLLASQIGDAQAAKAKTAKFEQQRIEIGQRMQPKPGETPRDTVHRAFQTALEMYRGGDIEGAKAGFSVLGSMSSVLGEGNPAQTLKEVPGVGLVDVADREHPKLVMASKDMSPTIVNAQEGVFEQKPDGLYNVATGQKWKGGTIHPVQTMGSFSTFQDFKPGDPNAPPDIRTINNRTGAPGPVIGTGKATALKLESAQQELTKARAEASVSEMNNADGMMQEFEQKLRDGKVQITGISQLLGSMANTFTHDDPASKVIQNATLAAINKTNPEFARYIRRALSFAEGESGISARPSDFRTRMAAFLSQAASGASKEMLDDISSRRTVILRPLNRIYSEAAAEGRGAPSPAPTAKTTPAKTGVMSYEDWKKSQGRKP